MNRVQPKITEFKLTHEYVETHKNYTKMCLLTLEFQFIQNYSLEQKTIPAYKDSDFSVSIFKIFFVYLFVCLNIGLKNWKTTKYQNSI